MFMRNFYNFCFSLEAKDYLTSIVLTLAVLQNRFLYFSVCMQNTIRIYIKKGVA